jgi:hypothetical protein
MKYILGTDVTCMRNIQMSFKLKLEKIYSTLWSMLQNQLKPAIWRKCPDLLSSGVCLQHDNARPHTACYTIKQIHDLKFEVLPHEPYSVDLAPSSFHLFWPVRDAVCGRHFRLDDEVKEAVHDWLAQQPRLLLLLLRILCLSRMMEEVCRMWWGLHLTSMSVYCIYFCNKSLYMIFLVFIWMTRVQASGMM